MPAVAAMVEKLRVLIRPELDFVKSPSNKARRGIVRSAFLPVLLFLCLLLCPACSSNRATPPETSFHPSADQKAELTDIGIPVRVKIPTIKVDAAIVPVGLTSAGAMDVPGKLSEAGWYKLGPRPGQQGSAVLAGHRSHRASVPAIFDNLRKVSPGDRLYVNDDRGNTISFVVREIKTYDKGCGAGEVFNRRDGRHLNLVTCDGRWIEAQKTFDRRLVVFADAVQ